MLKTDTVKISNYLLDYHLELKRKIVINFVDASYIYRLLQTIEKVRTIFLKKYQLAFQHMAGRININKCERFLINIKNTITSLTIFL